MGLGIGFWLNMLLAAVASALFVGFATEARAATAARHMRQRYFQARVGFMVTGIGVALQATGYALEVVGNVAFGLLLHSASYAFVLLGLLVVAATTWRPAPRHDDGGAGP